jgi:hypothetical protein
MSELLGAWSLSGRPLAEGARLRLSAAPGCLRADAGLARAYEGWLPDAFARDWTPRPPDGHYAAVRADLVQGVLELWRDPTAGETLFFAQRGDLLLFSSSMKPLLDGAGLDEDAALERALAQIVHFGDRTAVAGIRQLRPGHVLRAADGRVETRWAWGELLRGEEGCEEELARELRRRLAQAVRAAIGPRREAVVTLSGGIDSAAVAALACEAVGPENVRAYTYAFDDPSHPGEVAEAADLARHLGIGRHRVLRFSFEQLHAAVPEAVWLSEEPTCWARPHMLLLARALAADGAERFLTGFGVGSHMAYLEDVAAVLRRLPARLAMAGWKSAHYGLHPGRPSRWHPGLASPDFPLHTPLYYLLTTVLRRRGLLWTTAGLHPPSLSGLFARLARSPRVAEAVAEKEGLPLGRLLQTLAFESLDSCVDLHRLQKLSRRAGALWMAPAHMPSCLPLTFFPSGPRAASRPGKRLLQLAMRGSLPERVLSRPKIWRQATAPDPWLQEAARSMTKASEPSLRVLDRAFGWDRDAALRFCRNGALPFAFWHRMFLLEPRDRAPTWETL